MRRLQRGLYSACDRMTRALAQSQMVWRGRAVVVGITMVAFAHPQILDANQAGPPAQPAAVYQRFAPIDLIGTWVAVVTEEWHLRMITPQKGDFTGLTINDAARLIANAWDPAQDERAGAACKAYGAPAIMRVPGRVRMSWQDGGATLKMELDAGQQTRLLHFEGTPSAGPASWQGYSQAEWDYAGGFDPAAAAAGRGRGGRGGPGGTPAQGGTAAPGQPSGAGGQQVPSGSGPAGGPPALVGQGGPSAIPQARRGGPMTAPQGGALKVVTSNLQSGYLRKNGVPYSDKTTVTEYYNLLNDPNGSDWLIVTTIVHDPVYLLRDYITSSNFKKEPNDSKWRPRPCSAR